jgi:hypothetical protein
MAPEPTSSLVASLRLAERCAHPWARRRRNAPRFPERSSNSRRQPAKASGTLCGAIAAENRTSSMGSIRVVYSVACEFGLGPRRLSLPNTARCRHARNTFGKLRTEKDLECPFAGVILGVIRFATAANSGEQAQTVANSGKALNPCPRAALAAKCLIPWMFSEPASETPTDSCRC